MWTSPSSTDYAVHLQSVVTFDKHVSLITILVQGIMSTNVTVSSIKTITTQPSITSEEDKNNDSFTISSGNIIIIIVLIVFIVIVTIIFTISFIKMTNLKKNLEKTTKDELTNKNFNKTPSMNMIV